jgi:hypothetical protein
LWWSLYPVGERAQHMAHCVGEPHPQASTLAQAGVVLAPVLNLASLLGDMVAAVLVQLERQDGYLGSE